MGRSLRRLRTDRGLSQHELAKQIGARETYRASSRAHVSLIACAGTSSCSCPLCVGSIVRLATSRRRRAAVHRRCRHVEAGVPVEEADGLELEADGHHGHHRPVFGADDVM